MMKKYLMTGLAAVALSGFFSACSKDMESGEQITAEFNILEKYENAFVARFGQPAANQDWGFGSTSGTRGMVATPYVTPSSKTYNAQMAQAWVGVEAAKASGSDESLFNDMNGYVAWKNSAWNDQFFDVHGSVESSAISDELMTAITNVIVGTEEKPGLIPENVNNLAKAQSTGYSIVTTGGPVTLTPIYHYSNSGDRLSYYYYPAGSKPSVDEIKTMPKYSLGNMSDPQHGGDTHLYKNTYSLVYVDGNGNCSYDFPANYVINFVISNTWNDYAGNKDKIYQEGGVTSTTGGSEATLTSQGKYQVEANRYYTIGETVNTDIAEIRFGNTPSIPQFTMKSDAVQGCSWGNAQFKYRVEGNGVNGNLNGGSTVYYFQPTENGTIRAAVTLNQDKRLYIKDLGNDGWYNTSGTSLQGYDGISYNYKFENVVSFSVDKGKVYALYAEGSSLGFLGFMFEYQVWRSDWNSLETKTETDGVFTRAMGPFNCGDQFGLGKVNIRLGRKFAFEKSKENSQINGYTALTEGTGVDGSLTADRATVYYIKPKSSGEMEVAVALNAGKQFYIKDLSNNATSLANYDGITVGEKYYGTYRFPVEEGHEYAIYAEGSKLGFYGCEFFTRTGGSESTTSTSTVVWKEIPRTPDYYSDGDLNTEIHSTGYGYGVGGYGVTDTHTSHTAVFKSTVNNTDYTFIGFEDWVDFDFNDLVFAITGTTPETPQDPIEIPEEEEEEEEEDDDPGTFVCRIIAEDLTVGENSDFDFNDVVFDVFCDGSTTTIRLRAAGGELPLYVDGHEVHQEFGYSNYYPLINTGRDGMSIDYTNRYVDFTIGGVYNSRELACTIPVMVTKKGSDRELIDILLTARTGKVASKVCVGRDYEWCAERQDIDNKFHKADGTKLFQQYVIGHINGDWADGTGWYQQAGQ